MSTATDCGSDHCITCSDEGVPMRVLERQPDGLALCADETGAQTTVMTDLVGPLDAGDVVLVHAGVALACVAESPEDFRR